MLTTCCGKLETNYLAETLRLDQFNRMLATAVLVHEAVLATSWLLKRYSASYGLALGVEVSDAHPSAVTLRVDGNDARFLLSGLYSSGPRAS